MLIKEIEGKCMPVTSSNKMRLDALKKQKDNLDKTIKTTKAQELISQGQQQLKLASQS